MKILNVEQGTPEWHEQRFGCVTGTRLQSALGASYSKAKNKWTLGKKDVQNTLMYELISERMSQNEIFELNVAHMERGNELEPFAVNSSGEARGITFDTCGMLESEAISGFKFSPDAVHYNNGIITGGLETKCPNGKKHIEYLLLDRVPPEYFWQVNAPFLMSKKIEWWDFASYDDRNYQRELFIIRTHRGDNLELIQQAEEILIDFLNNVDEVHEGLIF